MGIEAYVNIGAAVLGGGLKGWADEFEIPLGAMDYALPLIGISTWPFLNKMLNSDTSIPKTMLAASLITGASYGLARGAARIAKYHMQ